ncbi:ABC transporter permease [Saccharibacillus endophyticus]|uniref:ABC transporter permease n=1 Tax=Saccharibacillus endophyticus TaxID=2060666 RepID=A0ABQ1ZPG5_9BACL|nr:ABC transporter permease [Saccharibacillus endophyticus]GGH73686.1 ABC transporter permease [Saccharibacillus endophyticus]
MNSRRASCALGFGVALLALLAGSVFTASWLSPDDPLAMNVGARLQQPGMEHWLGTDRFGRDILTRTLHGGQTTLISCGLALLSAVLIGMLLGALAGMFHGSVFDIVLMRIIDVLLAFPFMVFAMVIAALFGTSLFHLLFAVVVVWWVSFARLTRSLVFQAKNSTAVDAARVLGTSNTVILFRELLPQALGPVLVLATFELGNLILAIAALSFLGLGSQPPSPEWGSMLADGRAHFMTAPHVLLGPALWIILTVLAFNCIGEGLRDRMDPYEKARIG